ncbi:MAG TPA: EF-P lysine aminoacylase EpmA [Chloroflexia bacterium]|nr:EF-P lysine aminoacylase EpmA [Chloroflexia bacterium]
MTTRPTWQRLHAQPALLPRYLLRERIIRAIREFFYAQDFHEVETPLLVPVPSMEPYLEVFETEFEDVRGGRQRAFLTNSPEYAMKRLLVAGLPRIFQICKAFRNREDTGRRRNPEFTILEWYRAHADYQAIMADCEALVAHLYHATLPAGGAPPPPGAPLLLRYQGIEVDLTPPWERLRVREALAQYAGLAIDSVWDRPALAAEMARRGYTPGDSPWDELLTQLFANEVEPHLGRRRPTILYEYPLPMAGLARRARDPRYAERFEFYIAGLELGNAFSELADPDEQAARLQADQAARRRLGKKEYPVDADFLAALRTGMPPAGGIAVGVDRLIMLFADVASIHDTLWMPGRELFGPATGEEL